MAAVILSFYIMPPFSNLVASSNLGSNSSISVSVAPLNPTLPPGVNPAAPIQNIGAQDVAVSTTTTSPVSNTSTTTTTTPTTTTAPTTTTTAEKPKEDKTLVLGSWFWIVIAVVLALAIAGTVFFIKKVK